MKRQDRKRPLDDKRSVLEDKVASTSDFLKEGHIM